MSPVPFPVKERRAGTMRIIFVRERGPLAAVKAWWNRSRWTGVYIGENGSEHVYSCGLLKAVHDAKLSDVRARYRERSEMVIAVPDVHAGLDFLFSMLGQPGEEIRSDELPFFALQAAGRELPTFFGDRLLVGLSGLREALVLSGACVGSIEHARGVSSMTMNLSPEEIAAFKRLFESAPPAPLVAPEFAEQVRQWADAAEAARRVPSLFPGEVRA